MRGGRILVGLIGAVLLAGSGTYVFLYLYRWEWNRALISGLMFLAAEVAVIGWALLSRLAVIDRRLERSPERHRSVLAHLDTARGEQRSAAFAWLRSGRDEASVFIPILMGAGLLLSGLAWCVERVARATAGRSADGVVADQLARLGPPAGGFLDDSDDPLRALRSVAGGRR